MSVPIRIYLASRSPRRRELLRQIHVDFDVLLFRGPPREDPETNEAVLPGDTPEGYARGVARAKALFGARLIPMRRLFPQVVLAADTVVEVGGEILGKPSGAEHASEMLTMLSGRWHRVLTAVAVADAQRLEEALNVSEVRFRDVSADEVRRYVASGEPLDKAGAYGIQGRAAVFIEEIRGSYSGIMGLPLFEAADLLRRFGYSVC